MRTSKVRDLAQSIHDDTGRKRYAVWWQRCRELEAGHDAVLHCTDVPPRVLAERLKDAVDSSGPVIIHRVEEQ